MSVGPKIVFFEVNGHELDLRTQVVDGCVQPFALRSLGNGVVHFKDRDFLGFLEPPSAAVESGAQQNQLAGSSENRIIYQIVDRPSPYDAGTSRVGPSKLQNAMD